MAKKKLTSSSLGLAFLSKGLAAADNEYASVVSEGLAGDVTHWIDTGSYSLNGLISSSLFGGLPGNKTLVFAGEQSTGKTYLTLGTVKRFLDSDPNAIVYYWDSEFAVTSQMIITRGIDENRIVVLPVATIQEFRTQSLRLLDKYMELPKEERPPMMLVLDSLGMLSSTKELEDSTEGKETADMTKARLGKSVVRTLIPKLGKAGVALIITNHTYDVIGAYVPTKKMGGGGGPMYAASTIIFLSKAKLKDADKNVIGNIITCRAEKSRFTREQTKCQIMLDYTKGADRYFGLLDLGLKHNLIVLEGKKYNFPDGNKYSAKEILATPEKFYTDEVMAKLEEVAIKEYGYGSSQPADEEADATTD